jgi:hypothetical protein
MCACLDCRVGACRERVAAVRLLCARRTFDGPRRVRPPWVVDEEDPLAVREAAHHFHAVVVEFERLAARVGSSDSPLRAAQGEIASDGRVVHHDVHVRLETDVAGHGVADALSTALVPCTWPRRTTLASG